MLFLIGEKMRIGFFFRDWYSMQLVLHVIPIEWLRLKINFLTFNLNHLIKNHSKIQKAKSEKVLKMWEEKRNCMGSQSSSFRMHNETMINNFSSKLMKSHPNLPFVKCWFLVTIYTSICYASPRESYTFNIYF